MMLFEVGLRMERTLENGAQAKVLEQFVVDAMSFTEAEATTTKEASAYGTKAKVNYITLDEKTDKEKKTPFYFFVNAETITDAKKAVDDFLGATMIDYSIATLDETKVLDVFRHDLNTNNED